MAEFTWLPDAGAQETRKPRIRASAFGDGYEQRITDGLNADMQSWEVSFSNRSESEIASIASFLAGCGGVTPFSWAAPGSTFTVTDHGFGVGDGSKTAFQIQATKNGTVTDALGTWPTYTAPRTNLLLYSQDFSNAAWTKIQTGLVQNVTTLAAPDGTFTMARLTATAGQTSYVQRVVSVTPGAIYTESFYLAADTAPSTMIRVMNAGATVEVGRMIVNWTNGIPTLVGAVGVLSYAIIPVSGGIYRLSITVNVGSLTSVAVMCYEDSSNGSGSIYIWGAQFEPGSGPTRYIPTTSAAVTVTPAYWPSTGDGFEPVTDFTGAPAIYRTDWQGKQQLYPTARTNLIVASGDMSNTSYWSRANILSIAQVGQGPDGSAVSQVTPNTTSGQHFVTETHTTTAQSYTFSCWAKANGYSGLYLQIGSSVLAHFDLAAGAVGSTSGVIDATITPYPNGWYRVTLTGNAPAGPTTAYIGISSTVGVYSFAGNGTSGVYVWGAQLEVSSAPTSYIPTTSAAVTVIDYTLSSGAIIFANAPVSGALLTWSGTGRRLRLFLAKEWQRRADSVSGTVTAKFQQVPA